MCNTIKCPVFLRQSDTDVPVGDLVYADQVITATAAISLTSILSGRLPPTASKAALQQP